MAILLCGAALALGACTRATDGSFELANPPTLPAFMTGGERLSQPDTRSGGIALTEYPRAPAATSGRALPIKAAQAEAWKPAPAETRPDYNLAAAANTISCQNEASADGRVRVVCD